MAAEPVTLETPRLLLRPWRAEDRAPFFTLNCEPAVVRHLMPLSREGSDAMLDRIDDHFAAHGWGLWALEDRGNGRLVGLCGLTTLTSDLPFAPGVEIGWRLATAAQGKGLAREAATAALGFGFESLGLERIVAFTVPANTASWGLMRRLGMRETGRFHHPRVPAGHPLLEHVLYALDTPAPITIAPHLH